MRMSFVRRTLALVSAALLAAVLLGAALWLKAQAETGIRYEFDDIKVFYAAEFSARPEKVSPESWIARLAGGPGQPIKVLFGVVEFVKGGQPAGSEEFIKVEGLQGSERFLVNSGHFSYYENTNKFREVRSFFWSAKKIEGTSVVKDFTPPVRSIIVWRKFAPDQRLEAILLSFSDDGLKANQDFWAGGLGENVYMADMNTLVHAGEPAAQAPQPSGTATPTPTPAPWPTPGEKPPPPPSPPATPENKPTP